MSTSTRPAWQVEHRGVDLKVLTDLLQRRGRVRGRPAALSLFKDEVPDTYEGRKVEPCAIVHHAMDLGERAYVDAEHQACLAGAWQAGFLEPDVTIQDGSYLSDRIPGFLPVAANAVKNGTNVLPQGTVRAIGSAPLDEVPVGVDIDVVVVVCEPVYASTLAGVRTAVDGTPPSGAAGSSLCGELFAVPWHHGNVIMTPGDMGGRMFNKIRPNEMFVIIPFKWVGHLIELLSGTPDVPGMMESIKPGYAAERDERMREAAARRAAARAAASDGGEIPADQDVPWDDDARAILAAAPEEIREFAEPTLVAWALENGHDRITIEVMSAQMESIGMRLEDVMALAEEQPGDNAPETTEAAAPAAAPTTTSGDPDFDVEAKAPVLARNQVEVAASPEVVWAHLGDVLNWSSVYDQLKEIKLEGPVAAGTAFSFKAGPGVLSARLEVVDPNRALGFSGEGMGARSRYLFTIEPADNGCVVTGSQSIAGMAVRPMKKMLQGIVDESLGNWVAGLKAASEVGA